MKITSAEIRALFPAKVDKLLFSKEWTLPNDEQIDAAVAEIVAARKARHTTDKRIQVKKLDCARNVIYAVATMAEYDYPAALVQIPGHAVLWIINDKKEQRCFEMLDGHEIDQEIKENLIFMV